MDGTHKRILTKRRIKLLDINPRDGVLDYLVSESMLAQDEYSFINDQPTPKKQATKLIDTLPRKGKRAFVSFVNALMESDSEAHQDLAQMLIDDAAKAGVPITETDGAAPPPLVTMKSHQETARPPAPFAWPVTPAGRQGQVDIRVISPGAGAQEDTDFDLAYSMRHTPSGLALIVNNRNFTCGMKDRQGSDVDAKALDIAYTKRGFITHTLTNITGQQLRDNLYSLAMHDHTDYDAVIVTILSHGVDGKVYGTDGDLVEVSKITSYFRGDVATTLLGKPKVFVLQACRGGTFDEGIESTDGPGDSAATEPAAELSDVDLFRQFLDSSPANPSAPDDETDGHLGTLPVEADMVIAYATVPGYVSWRNSERGSWFIQALVKVLREHSTREHLLDMLTIVNHLVATEFQSKGRQKQMPAPVTHLRKKFHFKQ